MFTGIIQKIGKITRIEESPSARKLAISYDETDWHDVQLGDSIAADGVCLTLVDPLPSPASGTAAHFFVSQETLARTALGSLKVGSSVNLERALRPTSLLSGHIVQGHVDGLATFRQARPVGESYEVVFEVPAALARYCVEKGSITLNGVSLTLNRLRTLTSGALEVMLMLIPHTWQHTNLSQLKAGDAANVEVDVLAKYVERLCQPYLKP